MRNEMKHDGTRTQAISQVILGDGIFYAKKQTPFVDRHFDFCMCFW